MPQYDGGAAPAGRRHRWVTVGVTGGFLVRGAWCSSPQLVVGHVRRVAVHVLKGDLRERLVGRVTVKKSWASAGITSRQAYQVCGQPCTSSSGGPPPPVTTCWRRSPVSTYRLVNVPVNPAGRCGAPETEPGPSGAGRPAGDEHMKVPFHKWYCF